MKNKIMVYPPGSVMVFTHGEYSDYHIAGFLVAIQKCDLPALAQRMANGKIPYDDEDAIPANFASWLVAHGYAMPVDHSLIHVGDYGRWSSEFGVVPGDYNE